MNNTFIHERTEWQNRAACRGIGGDSFYVPHGGSNVEAKLACSRCEVQRECLSYALRIKDEWGVWGGADAPERSRLRRRARERGVALEVVADEWVTKDELRWSA